MVCIVLQAVVYWTVTLECAAAGAHTRLPFPYVNAILSSYAPALTSTQLNIAAFGPVTEEEVPSSCYCVPFAVL